MITLKHLVDHYNLRQSEIDLNCFIELRKDTLTENELECLKSALSSITERRKVLQNLITKSIDISTYYLCLEINNIYIRRLLLHSIEIDKAILEFKLNTNKNLIQLYTHLLCGFVKLYKDAKLMVYHQPRNVVISPYSCQYSYGAIINGSEIRGQTVLKSHSIVYPHFHKWFSINFRFQEYGESLQPQNMHPSRLTEYTNDSIKGWYELSENPFESRYSQLAFETYNMEVGSSLGDVYVSKSGKVILSTYNRDRWVTNDRSLALLINSNKV